jgi:hypothetical protein
MQNIKPNIVWEKWIDPFGQNLDDTKWSQYDSDAESYEDDETSDSASSRYNKINAIATNMGIIPYNEYTDCSKIFNFWLGHTNFNLTKKIVDTIESIEGVETLDIFTRYRFRVAFGKAFSDREVMANIVSKVCNTAKPTI